MTEPIRIVPVTDRKGLLRLIEFPFHFYSDDPYWVPPFIEERLAFFNPKKNPFYEHARSQLWLAYRGEKLVGTVGAVVDDNHNRCHDEQTGMFGFFEVIDDQEVADSLLETAEDWVRAQGMKVIRGPMNFSTNQEVGTLVEGFDSAPVVMMTYNPPYHPRLIESRGYVKAQDLYAYTVNLEDVWKNQPPKAARAADRLVEKAARSGITVRHANLRHFREEVVRVKGVYNQAWQLNWGFVPMTDHEIDHLAAGLKQFVDEDLVFIAEKADGTPVGVSLTLPDVNQALLRGGGGHMFPFGALKFLWHRRKVDGCRLVIMGVLDEYRSMGIDAVFYIQTVRRAIDKGYKTMEASWILESNTMMNRIIERLGGVRYKTYRIYEKAL